MADKPKTNSKGERIYGPYEGSKKNGGREIYVIRKKDGSTTSTDRARKDYEDKTGKKLSKDTHVDHKDGRKENNRPSNLQAMKASDNIAKGNRERKKK